MTRPSSDEVGPANFVVKRDWRDELDKWVRREGHQLFAPKTGGTGTQPYPNSPDTDEAITLIFTARKDNGKSALVVGTPTTLYRFFAFEDLAIYEADILDAGIYTTISDGTWLIIGTGFSTSGHRWEAVNVAGKTVFNNGYDLPVSYDLHEFAVKPLYELREQGVAFVGTIMEISGILLCMDIAEIHESYLATVMGGGSPYGAFVDDDHYDRVQYNTMWSDPLGPTRWGASVPGSITAGTLTLTLSYNVTSLQAGDAIRIVGAGASGGDLLTTLAWKSGTATWILSDAAATTVSAAAVSLRDAATLICGQFPLKDDSSPIIRAIKTQDDQIIVAKTTGFIIGQYTGNAANPFAFVRVYTGDGALFWRWTLVDVGGALLYAGEDDFYLFDLVSRRPQVHPRLTLCRDVFFSQVATATQDNVFAADNTLIGEVWFIFPSSSSDKALAYDYRPRGLGGDRCSTLGAAYSAAAAVDKPSATIAYGATEQWFVLGTSAGTVLQYGMDKTGPTLWTRNGENYSSDLWAGSADFGDVINETHVDKYLLMLASHSPNNSVTVGILAERNAGEGLVDQDDSPITFSSPKTRNMVPVHYQAHLFQDRITVSGDGNVQISKRVWSINRQGGGSMDRR